MSAAYKLERLYPLLLFLLQIIPDFLFELFSGMSIMDCDGLSGAACALSRGRAAVWAPIYPAILTLCCSPLSLHMEEGGRSFVVWWRCVLTQRGDEDGILIGLIELMVLSPLVGEECQTSLWRCASWLLSAFCSCTPAPIWTLSFRLCVLFSVSPPCCLSSPLSFTVLFSFHSTLLSE